MKKITAILTILSAAAAVSLSSLPVSAFYDNPIEKSYSYDHINLYGVSAGGAFYYKNGEALKITERTIQLILTPAEGVTLTAELLGLPDKYTLTADETTSKVRLPKYPISGTTNEMEEQKICVRKAIRKGLITKAEIEYGISGKCVDEPRAAIKLRKGVDIDTIIAEYPGYELTADNTDIPEEYKDYDLFSRAAEKGENINEFFNDLISDKFEAFSGFMKTCDDIHSIYKLEPFSDEYSYIEDPENIVWSEQINNENAALYNNGKYYANLKKKLRITFMTTDDYRNSSDFTDLPDKFTVYDPEWRDDELCLERQIDLNTIEELDEAAELVKGWAVKGVITEPKIWRHYSYNEKVTFYACITLNNTDDFESVLKDYPDFDLYDSEFYIEDKAITEVTPEIYTGDRQNFILILPEEKYSEIREIEKELQADSRIQKASINIASGKTAYFDDDEMIEYTAPEATSKTPNTSEPSVPVYTPSGDTATMAVTDGAYIKGDISGNGKIDIYDAIEIAKSLTGTRVFNETEELIADYNGNGKVDLHDAIAIAQKIISDNIR